MFDNKFDLYRSEVCPEIEKIIIIVDLFYQAYSIVDLFTILEHILEHTKAPLLGLYYNTEKCMSRIKRGCF